MQGMHDASAQRQESWSEVGQLPVRYYDTTTFDASPENWSITQDEQGFIYAGNTEGLLIHNGRSWDLIPVPGGMVHAVTVGADQRIYIGGYKELGYLGSDSTGLPQYVSLKAHLPDGFDDFIYAEQVFAVNESIFFISDHYIFCWKEDKFTAWKTKSLVFGAVEWRGKLVFYGNDSLFKLDNSDKLKEITWQEKALTHIRSIVSDGPDHLLVASRQGLYRCSLDIESLSSCAKIPTEAVDFQNAWQILRLKDGKLAIQIQDKGVALLDSSFQLLRHFDTNSGLISADVIDIFVDRDEALWLASRDGIVRLEASGNWSSFSSKEGLSGFVTEVVQWEDRVFVSTFVGLYELVPGDGYKQARFQQIHSSENVESCYEIKVVNNIPVAACLSGLFRIALLSSRESYASRLIEPNFYPWKIIVDPTDPSLFYVAGQREIAQYRLQNHQIEPVHIQKITPRIHRIVESPQGSELARMRFWVVSDEGVIYKISVPTDESNWQEEAFYDFDQLDSRVQEFFFLGNTFFSASSNGLLGLNALSSDSPRFKKETVIGDHEVDYWGKDHSGNAWLTVDDTVRVANYSADGQLQLMNHSAPARIETLAEVEYFEAPSGTVWFGHRRGVVRVSPEGMKTPRSIPSVKLTEASVHGRDSVIYKGPISRWNSHTLSHKENSIRLEYAAQVYDLPERVQYRVWLEGYDQGWSSWAPESVKEYTNLRENTYVFHVQAKHPVGTISRTSSYSFEVLPPWYRSQWAYALWILSSVLTIGGIIWAVNRIQTHRLHARNVYLNRLVEEKTEEIRSKNDSLQDAYYEVQVINDDLKKTNSALENRTDKLREALEINKEILGITAHDLKNPLGGIIGLAEMLLEDLKEGMQATYKSASDHIPLLKDEAERMLQIIKDLLDKHREGEKPTLRKEKTALGDIISAVVRWNTKQATDKGIQIHYQAQELFVVEVDILALQRVLDNYVSNAVKYSPAKSNINISVSQEKDAEGSSLIRVSVRDEGPGLTQKDLQKVFGKMQRLSAKPTGGEHSTGLGLFIAKQLIEAHGGEVGVDSTFRKGATFWFTLAYQHLEAPQES